MTIGLTENPRKGWSPDSYVRWVQRIVPESEILLLSSREENYKSLEQCNALVLSGGGDVHPKFYNRLDALASARGVDERRDAFELKLIRRSLEMELPLLGICRGLQIVNVALGGSLFPDIVKSGNGFRSHVSRESEEGRHPVLVEIPSLLFTVVGVSSGEVNTQHHQAADGIGKNLKIAARSDDGVVEALEWEKRGMGPFLLLVQWHPERMADFENPFSKNIVERFVGAIETKRD